MCLIDGEKYESRAQRYTLFLATSAFEPSHSWKRVRHCQESGRKNLKSSAASLACDVVDFGSQWGLSTYFSYPKVRIRKEAKIGLVQTWSTGFGQDF